MEAMDQNKPIDWGSGIGLRQHDWASTALTRLFSKVSMVLEAQCRDVSNADETGGQKLLQVLDPDYCQDGLLGDELKQIVGFKGITFISGRDFGFIWNPTYAVSLPLSLSHCTLTHAISCPHNAV